MIVMVKVIANAVLNRLLIVCNLLFTFKSVGKMCVRRIERGVVDEALSLFV